MATDFYGLDELPSADERAGRRGTDERGRHPGTGGGRSRLYLCLAAVGASTFCRPILPNPPLFRV